MKKYLTVAVLSVLLTACGGGSDGSTGSTGSTGGTGSTNQTTPPKDNSTTGQLSKLQLTNPQLGEVLNFGNLGTAKADSLVNKKYYARYAYCNNGNCGDIRLGQLNFSTKQNGNALTIENLIVDKVGKINFDTQKVPHYQALTGGAVNLANASLTLVDTKTNRYNLKMTPLMRTEDKLPNVDIQVYFTADGMHLAGADDDYLFVAQQMNNAPNGWTNDASKASVAGTWQAFETDDSLRILTKSTINADTSEVIQGASRLTVKGTKGSFNGYYANLGAGYVVGYTDNNQPLSSNGMNYDGIDGMMLTAPDGQFGIGYDDHDKQSFLLFR